MDTDALGRLLEDVRAERVDVTEAIARLKTLPFEDVDGARLDVHRALRQGFPEVVFGLGKSAEQVATILARLAEVHGRVMATRITGEVAAAVRETLPEARYDRTSRLLTLAREEARPLGGGDRFAAVVSAGTADLPVAEEAAQTIEFHGGRVERAYDVGVAGLHRLLDHHDLLLRADVIVSVAGMEGALTSVLGGLVASPVVGVPTSVGYGASFGGVAALLAMLNACSSGTAVVNIDDGFGAGMFATMILRQVGAAA
ncbi:MAG: nickel pincer cofactor biosynthesis protein LarB [Gemmatimonadota bacterium]